MESSVILTYALLVKSRMRILYDKLCQPHISESQKLYFTKKFMDQIDSYHHKDHTTKFLIDSIYEKLWATDLYIGMDSVPHALTSLKSAIEELEHRIKGFMLMKKRITESYNTSDMLGTLDKLDGASRVVIASFL